MKAWDLAEYKRVEPAHFLPGATSGGTGGDQKFERAYHPLCFRESPRDGAKSQEKVWGEASALFEWWLNERQAGRGRDEDEDEERG